MTQNEDKASLCKQLRGIVVALSLLIHLHVRRVRTSSGGLSLPLLERPLACLQVSEAVYQRGFLLQQEIPLLLQQANLVHFRLNVKPKRPQPKGFSTQGSGQQTRFRPKPQMPVSRDGVRRNYVSRLRTRSTHQTT